MVKRVTGLRFNMSHPVTAAIPPGDQSLFKMALTQETLFLSSLRKP